MRKVTPPISFPAISWIDCEVHCFCRVDQPAGTMKCCVCDALIHQGASYDPAIAPDLISIEVEPIVTWIEGTKTYLDY
jgi:hypothetical protein